MAKNRDLSKFPNAITVLDNGSVGIGTTSLTSGIPFSINVTTGSNCNIAFQENASDKWYIRNITSSNAFSFYSVTGSTEVIRLTSSGNVGIGINPEGVINSKTLEIGSRGMIYDNNDNFAFVNNGYYDNAWRYKQTGAGVLMATNGGEFSFSTATSGNQGTALTWLERMKITSSGNVIIGGTSGNERLTLANAGAIGFQNNSNVQKWHIQWNSADGLNFVESSVADFRLFLKPGGYIGINTSTPGTTLPSGTGWTSQPAKTRVLQINSTDGYGNTGLFLRQTDNTTGLDLWSDNYYGNSYIDSRWNDSNGRMYFRLKTNGTPVDALSLTSSGQVLKPNQPAFLAYGNGNDFNTLSGFYLTYPTVHLNRGGHYNASNGVFTAPIAGVYYFSWSDIGGSADDVYRFYLRINNSNFLGDYHLRLDTTATGTNYGTNGNRSVVINLSANDSVRIYMVTDNTNTFYAMGATGNPYHNFMGYLIG